MCASLPIAAFLPEAWSDMATRRSADPHARSVPAPEGDHRVPLRGSGPRSIVIIAIVVTGVSAALPYLTFS